MAPIQALDSPQEQYGQPLPVSRTAHRISWLSYTVSQMPKNFILHPEYKVLWTFEAVSPSVRDTFGMMDLHGDHLQQFVVVSHSQQQYIFLFFPSLSQLFLFTFSLR